MDPICGHVCRQTAVAARHCFRHIDIVYPLLLRHFLEKLVIRADLFIFNITVSSRHLAAYRQNGLDIDDRVRIDVPNSINDLTILLNKDVIVNQPVSLMPSMIYTLLKEVWAKASITVVFFPPTVTTSLVYTSSTISP